MDLGDLRNKSIHNPVPVEMEGYGYGGSPGETFGAFGTQDEPTSKPEKKSDGSETGAPTGLAGKIPNPANGKEYLDNMLSSINYDLLVSKTFYFFFFAAFGSLFPLIAVYFKQLGMNPIQTGVLIGFRPFVEFVSGPFWSNIADRWNKWKQILLFSLFCWVAFTLALAFVSPPADSCLVHNGSAVVVVPPWMAKQKNGQFYKQLPQSTSANTTKKATEFPKTTAKPEVKERSTEKASKPPLEKETREGDKVAITTKAPSPQGTTHFNPYAEGRTVKFLPHPSFEAFGMSPLSLDHKDIANLDAIDVHGLVSPPLSAVVYRSADIQRIFLVLLILMVIGEFLSAPAIELADAATLGYLGEETENYGRQRLFGSLGWAISMFFVGIALDHSNIFPNHPCGNSQLVDRNYTVCFAVFAVLMSCAFIAGTQFKYKEGMEANGSIQLNDLKDKVIDKVQARIIKIRKSDRHSMMSSDDETPDYGYDQYKTGSGVPSSRDTTPAAPGASTAADPDRKLQISLQGEDGQPAQDMLSDAKPKAEDNAKPSPYVPRGRPGQTGRLPQWVPVLKLFGTIQHGSVLFILWFMGFGVGLVFAFLFWHLQDLHGTPTLFGIASVINHVSEVLAYFFTRKLISKIGHVKVLYMGMLGNVARYLYISWLRNPWWVLPFEFLQGLTHASVWAAGCSYLTQSFPVNMRPTAQGMMMAMHHGLGRACGAIIGGALINAYGTELTFRGYGITTIILLVGYVALNYFYISKYLPQEEFSDTHQVVEESSHLAPYGVPMSLSHSRSNMDDMQKGNNGNQQQYGSSGQSSGGNFLNPGNVPPKSDWSGAGDGGYQGIPDKNPYHHGYSQVDDVINEKPLDLRQGGISGRKMTDTESIRRGFQAYDQATDTQQGLRKPPVRDALIMGSMPKPATEICMQQPAAEHAYNQDSDWY